MSLTRTFLPASGTLSMGGAAGTGRSITERFGGATAHSMSEYYGIGVNTANVTLPESGPLKFSDFYNRTEHITTSRNTTVPGPSQPFSPGSPSQPSSGGQSGSPSFFSPAQFSTPGQFGPVQQQSGGFTRTQFGGFTQTQPFRSAQTQAPSFGQFFQGSGFTPGQFGFIPGQSGFVPSQFGFVPAQFTFASTQPFSPGQPSTFIPGTPAQPFSPGQPATPPSGGQPGDTIAVTEFLTRVAPEPS
jgi:hypothetical protein